MIATRARRAALALLAGAAIAAGCGGTGGDGGPTTSPATTGGSRTSGPAAGARAITVVGRQRLGARLEDWTLRTPALRGQARSGRRPELGTAA